VSGVALLLLWWMSHSPTPTSTPKSARPKVAQKTAPRAQGSSSVALATRTGADTPQAPEWMPVELTVHATTAAGTPVPFALVVGDCGLLARTDAEGVFTGLVAAGVCGVRVMREDGLLEVWSEAEPITMNPGERVETRFVLPEAVQGGVGIATRSTAGGVEVVAVRPESPAASHELKEGDRITRVDGHPTDGWSPRQFADHTMGPVGSIVVLEVDPGDRDTATEPISLALERTWLAPGKAPPTEKGSLARLSDAERRELAAIRDEYESLQLDDALEPDHPELQALRARALELIGGPPPP
jgi:hypothetical protein